MQRTNSASSRVPKMRISFGHSLTCFLAFTVATITLGVQPSHAHMKGMYETKSEAEARAAQIKCKGAFRMGDDWMPCENERALHDALQRQ